MVDSYYQHISALGKEAMAKKRANGERMHLAPLGFKNVRRNGKSVMIRDPKTHPLVCEARRLHRRGWSLRRICKRMAERGLRSQLGNVIGPGSMSRIFR